ncbi:MAG TPA: hypothetical protein RMH99_11685 [Sandaracinaceae bacterium LLY-WYZ-13_1]|nr:hypothetical protein [Sandaracinaceae bacterium LLY-WYZ-13_1]
MYRAHVTPVALCLLACPAAAQDAEGPPTEGQDAGTRALFEAATVAYGEGRLESALDHLQRSYYLDDVEPISSPDC